MRTHPDAEASNALAFIVIDQSEERTPGEYVDFSFRYGIAGDFLHWLDEHRPGWDKCRAATGGTP